MKACVITALVLFPVWLVPAAAGSFELSVKHDHLIGAGLGRLRIDSEGITFSPQKGKKHSRKWAFSDIREVVITPPAEMAILTYEDVWWKLNRDREFRFRVSGNGVGPEAVRFLRQRLPGKVVSAVFGPPATEIPRVPAKHLHSLGGGCDGELAFSDEGIYYVTHQSGHSRFWPFRAIESLGRQSTSRFRVTVPERTSLGGERNFQFQLKRPMDEKTYETVWRKIYEPESWLDHLTE